MKKSDYYHIRISKQLKKKLETLSNMREESMAQTARYILEKFFEKK